MTDTCVGNSTWQFADGTLTIGDTTDTPNLTDEDVTKIVIAAGATSIDDFAFSFFSRTETVELPEGLRTIGNGAFLFCESLTEINFPASVTEIGKSAFCGCWRLREVFLPAGLVDIGDNAFGNCSNLSGVELPEGLRRIGSSAFKGCENLTEIKIPASVVEVGGGAFAGCEALRKIHCVGSGVTFAENLRGGNRAEIVALDESPEKFTWQLDGDTLRIGGLHAAEKFFCDETAPWYDKREVIKKIFIE